MGLPSPQYQLPIGPVSWQIILIESRDFRQNPILARSSWASTTVYRAQRFSEHRSLWDLSTVQISDPYLFPVKRYETSKLPKIVIFARIPGIHRIPTAQLFELKIILKVEVIGICIHKKFQLDRSKYSWDIDHSVPPIFRVWVLWLLVKTLLKIEGSIFFKTACAKGLTFAISITYLKLSKIWSSRLSRFRGSRSWLTWSGS